MRANDLHGAISEVVRRCRLFEIPGGFHRRSLQIQKRHQQQVSGCYKATVNESETINEAKPLCLAKTGGLRWPVLDFPAAPSIERS